MAVVASFRSPIIAQRAARLLIEHGILASVHAPVAESILYDLLVLDRAAAERARDVLARAVFDSQDQIDAAPVPDLSRLPSAMAPQCPKCGRRLPLNAELARCPACGMEVDVPGLITQQHGPEALESCYDPPADDDEPDDPDEA
jgi:hypothetical protein